MATYTTGGNLPAIPLSNPPTTGGNLPPDVVPTTPGLPAGTTGPAPNVSNPGNTTQDPNALVQTAVKAQLDPNNAMMQSARRYALDQARARGLMNSSIAVGNSERAAIDSAMPLIQASLGLTSQREGADLSRRNSLDVAEANANLTNWLSGNNSLRNMAEARNQAGLTDWLGNQSFTRQFNGALAMMPIQNAFDLQQMINQYALSDPETYPPNVVSGLTNFLNQNMFSILKEYFPNLIKTGGGS